MNGSNLENIEMLNHILEQTLHTKSNYWLQFQWQEMPFISQKWNTMENLDILLEGYNTFLL